MLVGRRLLWCVVELFPQAIASAFVGRFRTCLQPFLAEEKPFPASGIVFKIVARWRYDWCANERGNCQNLRKWVQSLCTPLRPFRSEVKENFYNSLIPMYCSVHPYKIISLPRYRVPRKTVKIVPVVSKAHGRANFCAHRKSIKPCNFRKCFGGFL